MTLTFGKVIQSDSWRVLDFLFGFHHAGIPERGGEKKENLPGAASG